MIRYLIIVLSAIFIIMGFIVFYIPQLSAGLINLYLKFTGQEYVLQTKCEDLQDMMKKKFNDMPNMPKVMMVLRGIDNLFSCEYKIMASDGSVYLVVFKKNGKIKEIEKRQ